MSATQKQDRVAAPPSVFLMIDKLQTGGTERQFAALARALRSELFQVRLGCMHRKGAFLEGLGEIAEFDVGGSFFTLQAQRAFAALVRYLRRQSIAIAHSFDFYSNIMLIPAARLAGVPVVIGSQRQLGDLLSLPKRAAQSGVFRLSDRVVCNSRAAANMLAHRGLPDRQLAVIPNGLPNEAFTEVAPALPQSPGVLRVGLIGRMNDPVKNHAALLRTAARLNHKLPAVEYLLVGDGHLRPALEQMARELGISHRVRFLGERHDIASILASIDISVVASLSESLSNVILESMAAAKPVIATGVGGNAELVREGETGLLVPPNDEGKLSEALALLLAQPSLRDELGRKAQSVARAQFSMDRVREQYEQLYTDLLAQKKWQPDADRSVLGTARISNPSRVAIVAPSLRFVGGQAVQAELLLRHWQTDPAVEVRLIPIDPQLPRWLARVQRVPYLRTIVRTPFYLVALWRGMKHADIVHIFSASYWSFWLAPAPALAMARLLGKKTLVNYHSGEALDHLSRWPGVVPVLRRADERVVPSAYLAEVFGRYSLSTQVVSNIVDLDQFAYRPRRPLRPVLLNTRTFEPYYGVDLVVRAFAQIKKEFPEARLCLVGNGSLQEEIRSLVRDLKLDDVQFPGAISREKIGRFYDQADVFVNASWLDNMPVSILEAFASGMPVVTTAPDGIRHIVEHERTGLLCETRDWRSLAENIIRLLRDPELTSRLASNAYEESRRYRWEAVRDQWLRIYRSLYMTRFPTAKADTLPR